MREIWKLAWKLLAIAAVAGLALGIVNAVTKEPIEEQTRLAADAARKSVLSVADTFTLCNENVDGCREVYEATASGELVGYTALVATKEGYGNEIEVTVGVALDGSISGISVGGPNFSETAGLGAKSKEPAFRDQFVGLVAPVTLGQDVDAITSATKTSRAVTNAVNVACTYIQTLIREG